MFQWILDSKTCPPAELERAKANLKFSQTKLDEANKARGIKK